MGGGGSMINLIYIYILNVIVKGSLFGIVRSYYTHLINFLYAIGLWDYFKLWNYLPVGVLKHSVIYNFFFLYFIYCMVEHSCLILLAIIVYIGQFFDEDATYLAWWERYTWFFKVGDGPWMYWFIKEENDIDHESEWWEWDPRKHLDELVLLGLDNMYMWFFVSTAVLLVLSVIYITYLCLIPSYYLIFIWV